jgi:hypothetical protein
MTSAQSRIADTLEVFYGAADRAAEGAMAGHAYKRSVDDLDTSFTRELVRKAPHSLGMNSWTHLSGDALPNHNIGAFG